MQILQLRIEMPYEEVYFQRLEEESRNNKEKKASKKP